MLLVLVLYSDTSAAYKNMLQLQRNYLSTIPNIEYYFYAFRESQTDAIEIEKDMIYVKGKESLTPGCLVKTLSAMLVTEHKSYEYILRLNISTVVDIVKLREMIATNPRVQYAGAILQLNWTDLPCGITPEVLKKYRMLPYVRGIAILFHKNVVVKLLQDTDSINMNVVDDVAFGAWCKENGVPVTDWTPYMIENPSTVDASGPYFIYRNKHANREEDVKTMGTITSHLLQRLQILT